MESAETTDYYEILECDRTATFEELKKNYQRLILEAHPDKFKEDDTNTFHRIQKAWTVLRDPESRQQYDALLICEKHAQTLLYATVNLSDMEIEDGLHVYSCRCGGTYEFNRKTCKLSNKVIIGCDQCTFSIQINF